MSEKNSLLCRSLALLFVVLSLSNCHPDTTNGPAQDSGSFEIQSTGVLNGLLGTRYTCDGQSIAPPVSCKNIPAGTKYWAITLAKSEISVSYTRQ